MMGMIWFFSLSPVILLAIVTEFREIVPFVIALALWLVYVVVIVKYMTDRYIK